MSELAWYIYNQQQQLGPFEVDQIRQLYATNMIAQDAYVFKIGWKDWRPIEEVYDLLGIESVSNQTESNVLQRRMGAPRATIGGRVILHNNGQLIIGIGVNISATGMFIETKDQIFQLGETLNLTCKANGMLKQFNVKAEVIRRNDQKENVQGYGLKFVDLEYSVSDAIQKLVNAQNGNTDSDIEEAN